MLFDEIGLSASDRVVELGCGPRGCLELLSARVGSAGSVTGSEISPEAVALAQEVVGERQLSNVELRWGGVIGGTVKDLDAVGDDRGARYAALTERRLGGHGHNAVLPRGWPMPAAGGATITSRRW
jgi:tRNA A58 N-methylase Trm61